MSYHFATSGWEPTTFFSFFDPAAGFVDEATALESSAVAVAAAEEEEEEEEEEAAPNQRLRNSAEGTRSLMRILVTPKGFSEALVVVKGLSPKRVILITLSFSSQGTSRGAKAFFFFGLFLPLLPASLLDRKGAFDADALSAAAASDVGASVASALLEARMLGSRLSLLA